MEKETKTFKQITKKDEQQIPDLIHNLVIDTQLFQKEHFGDGFIEPPQLSFYDRDTFYSEVFR